MKRPLIIILILLFIFAIFFFFSLGKQPQLIGDVSTPTPKNRFDSTIQKNPDYVFVEGEGYIMKDRKVVLFVGKDTAQSRQAEILKEIEAKLEGYWKWQVLLGKKDIEDITNQPQSGELNRNEKIRSKNIFSRIVDVFKVSGLVNVVKDTDKTCDCDDDLVLLSGRDLHLLKTILNPDGGSAGSGNNGFGGGDSDEGNPSVIRSHFKQSIKEPQVGYGRKEPLLVGIIDSGIGPDKALMNRMNPTLNYNFINHSSDISDPLGHGTNIANIIVNETNDDVNIVGLKTFDDSNVGNLYDNLCAILYAAKYKIKVINASWGAYREEKTPVFEKVMEKAKDSNVVMVCSAGNDELDIDKNAYYPACYTDNTAFGNHVITVTSRDASDKICQNFSTGAKKIDLSMLANANCEHIIKAGVAKRGTSYAAPYVTAGVANYILGNPGVFSKSGYISSIPVDNAIKKYTNP
ncbi:MAG: S8/S53 family peptidase [Arcicella sp.]|jgi:hypothetical protein|nr:S8/S53 family peptidase [Arcicella sp.]